MADRGLARWRSIIPRTRKPAETRARWQSIASTRSHAPLPPTEPRQGCERTAHLSPSQARVPTSTTHERKRVCRWEARAGAPSGQSDAPVRTKAHAQWGRRQLPAIQERCWQVSWAYPTKHRTIERPPARWCRREHAAQPALRRRAVGSSTGKSQATIPKREHAHARGQQPDTVNWRSCTTPLARIIAGWALRQLSKHRVSIAHAHAPAAPREDGDTPDTPGRPNAAPSSHPIAIRRADPLEPGGSIVGHTKRGEVSRLRSSPAQTVP